jgi:hypothetical protein
MLVEQVDELGKIAKPGRKISAAPPSRSPV